MFPSMRRTINFEIVKTPKDTTVSEAVVKTPRTPEEIVAINAIFLANAQYAAVGLVATYAAIKAIDTASKIAIIKAAR